MLNIINFDQLLATARRRLNRYTVACAALCIGLIGLAYATLPAGLDTRPTFLAYLNNSVPSTSGGAMPLTLSATTAFSNTPARTANVGLLPYGVNSPLWADNAIKARYAGIPNPATVGFTATDPWTFPNGSVFVKNFDLVVNEQTNAIRRLETRILIRLADGTLGGATYRWRANNLDADLVTSSTNETINVTKANGSVVAQTWLYPSPSDCLICHNTNVGMVLGIKTAQMNGNITYPATGRTDNQLHTWHHIGMFTGAINDPPTSYTKMVDVGDIAATMEDRVKSYQDANCAHCHRPSGPGPKFDMRYESLITAPADGRDPIVANTGNSGLVRNNIVNSSIHQRDSSLGSPMPPLARNVLDQRILSLYVLWGHYAYDVTSVTAISTTQLRVQFDRAVDPATASVASNYAINDGVTVTAATPEPGNPNVVILTTSTLLADKNSYLLTVNRVKEAAVPQNPIWPNTQRSFITAKHIVTPSAGANGTIAPSLPKFVADQTSTAFTVTPNVGYTATVGGSCGGSLVGTTYTTNPVNTNCTVDASFTLNTYTVTSSAGAKGTISPLGAQAGIAHGATTIFTVSLTAGYTASVGGTCGGTLVGTTYTTNAVTANCSVIASFSLNSFTVTPSAGANGSISPSTPVIVASGATTAFTVTASVGYTASIATGAGHCGGSLVGTTYTTNAITTNCTVAASFTLNTYTVTPSAGANGTIAPSTPVIVNHGATPVFTVTPTAGYTASVGGTCGGTLVGTTYTTNAVTANCSVIASFSLNSFTVTPSAGANGSISPSTPVIVASGASTTFSITPNAGYAANVGGTCGGTLTNATYITNAVISNCTVAASFVPTTTFNIVLEGAQENPALAVTGTGSGTAVVNTVNNTITLNLNYSGATGTVTGAHLHGSGARGVNAGVKLNIGTNSPITDVVTYLEADEADILNGLWYVNLHTAVNGGGELRGQIDNLGAASKTLSVTRSGTGSGTVTGAGISCGADCSEIYTHNSVVALTATPTAGSTFTGWSGACIGTGSCSVTMNFLKTVNANFAVTRPVLTVNLTGSKWGSVTSSPAGINCPGACSAEFDASSLVTLTRTVNAATEGEFVGWTDPASCATSATCDIGMTTTPRNVAARFTVTCRVDIDGDTRVRASTDILLITRAILALPGVAVVDGAFNPLGARVDSVSINAYLQSRISEGRYDVNLDGVTDWRDAMILLRAYSGFKGDAVTTPELIPANAQRKFWDQATPGGSALGISQYLSGVCAAAP